MAFISGQDYAAIATSYAHARDLQLSIKEHLFDATYEIAVITDIIVSVDLLSEFYNSYQVNTTLFGAPQTLLGAVRRLNNHVLTRSSYSTLDAYLAAEGVTVPLLWAELCSASGFTISDAYIA